MSINLHIDDIGNLILRDGKLCLFVSSQYAAPPHYGGGQVGASHGCITVHPDDAENFFSNFSWNEDNSNIGSSTGSIFVVRNLDLLKGTCKIQMLNGTVDYYINLINGIQ